MATILYESVHVRVEQCSCHQGLTFCLLLSIAVSCTFRLRRFALIVKSAQPASE